MLAQFLLAPAVVVPVGGAVGETGTRLADVAPELLFPRGGAVDMATCDAWLVEAPEGGAPVSPDVPADFADVPPATLAEAR